ncbi:LysR family transcriptional regulator [Shewanella ulleungensis]|jgi:DNA-binding transcriptional LysR family regulator|uniref:LysR family transcriptional regulator n=1 Tax=Shewanella ulleungensis TaxID=2282699 RepID=A0ABQ2QPP2_9GAMM|nr:LysR family transcriptional regulator [Shewanella ulleungensis]MCL1150482.1 LysR family transcriptional regulator [Shewanella ulleungensis]GGP91523.1 LysR family transcriptional regulator [Shewanella ulleungensis]
MKPIDLDKLDLLTLTILVSLYEHKSATHVSKILNIPASKISRCLHTARLIFGDDLFIRRKYGLVPNDYAGKVYPIAKEIVDCAKHFNRVNSAEQLHHRYFELVFPGMIAYAYPRAIMQAIKDHNKNIHINVSSWSNHSLESLTNDPHGIVMCCCKSPDEVSFFDHNLRVEVLATLNRQYLLCCKNHPILKQEISLETIAKYPFINTFIGVQAPILNPFQEYCKAKGLPVNTEMTITSVSSLFEYLSDCQSLAITPYKAVYDMLDEDSGIHACQLSEVECDRIFQVVEPLKLVMVTYPTSENDDSVWLKKKIRELTLELI